MRLPQARKYCGFRFGLRAFTPASPQHFRKTIMDVVSPELPLVDLDHPPHRSAPSLRGTLHASSDDAP
jgi:hypothetical protein